ncbi:MAG TPA: hypothetical protein VKE88_02445, partial [Candidatus Nanoarchaeia archaeon]|nr:hypothetical protein [Candidatus Nanoarchaeia archaeon]
MVDTLKKDHSIKVFSEGLIGKGVELRFLEARQERKTVVHAVHNKNEVLKGAKVIPQKIKEHKINEVDEWTTKYIDTVHDLLQETYLGIFGELRPMKQDLELIPKFLEKHHGEFTLDEIRQYEKYLLELRVVLDAFRKYLDELDAALKGREVMEGSLNIKLVSYNLSSLFHPVRNMLEWYRMRSEAKATYKQEKRIEDLQNKKELSP